MEKTVPPSSRTRSKDVCAGALKNPHPLNNQLNNKASFHPTRARQPLVPAGRVPAGQSVRRPGRDYGMWYRGLSRWRSHSPSPGALGRNTPPSVWGWG